MGKRGSQKDIAVIKPIGWRQIGFAIFLFLCGLFFAFVDFLGFAISLAGTVILTFAGLLNLFDQLFEWSRLKIDREGFHLRSWWTKQSFRHEEIQGFETEQYAGRKLVVLVLKPKAQAQRGLVNPGVPFACAFGRPVETVVETLRAKLKKAPAVKRTKREKELPN